jgi:hypothetical protein
MIYSALARDRNVDPRVWFISLAREGEDGQKYSDSRERMNDACGEDVTLSFSGEAHQ